MTEITKYDEAITHHNNLINYIRVTNKASVLIGMELDIIHKGKLFLSLGKGGYDNWTQYLSNGEIGFSQASAYNYINIYKFFVEKHGFDIEKLSEIKYTRLLDVSNNSKDSTKEQVEEELESAKLLNNRDLIEKKIDEGKPPRPKVTWNSETKKWIISVDQRTTEILYL